MHSPTNIVLDIAVLVAIACVSCGAGPHRNRPDRRKVPQNEQPKLPQPIVTFTTEDEGVGEFTATFSEDLVDLDLTDPLLLNSIRVWMPVEDFEGVATSATRLSTNQVNFVFGQTLGTGNACAIWIFDQRDFFRGRTSGSRCTGNPALCEGN